MTNQQIIFNQSQELMKTGIIGTTGRSVEIETEGGEKITLFEPEPIHTFQRWKELGRQVRKGEHAKAAFTIWKAGKAKSEVDPNETDPSEAGMKMFMKRAFFFTFAQTEPAKA